MKKLPKLFALAALILIYSCSGGDETPSIVPMPNFNQDRLFIQPGETVTFTNTSTDGESYSWNFGDNSTLSTDENPTHTFNAVGNFNVTLSVTSSTGDVATSTSSVTVGNRWAVALAVTEVQFVNGNGDAWDPDGSGPEILFGFFPVGQAEFDPFILGDDITSDDLPIAGAIDESLQVAFTDTDWTFAFLDNDDPLTDPNTSDLMTSFNLNPVRIPTEEDYYQNGEGQFSFTANGYSIIIAFDIKAN
ncbi:hypothetical protein BFP97_10250 [Roseivirga sp. 4D4]|uniref:PKD domain-containing protein n=1 Tax=Roseivirga sp. 4D4 TaxID=1889784 RepID=UPI0008536F94|nr:PKD domain-containing protein [Roseivirga sp. 4D4]OEK01871.1 hypothetical protein BFP97_10250 [Roseivirga sp. 4D4]